MKLIVVTISFIIFIFKVSSLEIDPTDDRTIEHFLAQFFQGGDPSTFRIIETEVKQHSDELLNGFLSLVGGAFDFESSDMKTQLNKFKEDFDVEKLKKIVEDIFGIGSVVVAQLQKNSDTVKDKVIALIDIVLEDSGPARKKRSNEDQPETIQNSCCAQGAGDSLERNNPENQQNDPNEKKAHHARKVHSGKKNKEQKKAHPKKAVDYITPGVKFHKRADVAENDIIPTQNEGTETLHLDSVASDSIRIIEEERNQHDTLDYKLENGLLDGAPIQESDEGLQDDTQTQTSDTDILDSLIPDSNNQKNEDEEKQHDQKLDNGLLDDTQTHKSDKGLLDAWIPDSKDQKNDKEQKHHDQKWDSGSKDDTSTHKSGKGLLDAWIPDSKDRENDKEQKQHDHKWDSESQDDTSTHKSGKGLLDAWIPDSNDRENDDDENSHHRSNHKHRSDNWLLDSVIPDSMNKEDDYEEKHRYDRPSHKNTQEHRNRHDEDDTRKDHDHRNQHRHDEDDTRKDHDHRNQHRHDTTNYNDHTRKEVRGRLRNLGVLSQEFVEELLDLSQINMEVMEDKARKAMGAVKENVDVGRARALDFFNIYGNYFFEILERNAEKMRELFRI